MTSQSDTPPAAGPHSEPAPALLPGATPEEVLSYARAFVAAIPHARALGFRLDEIGGGRAVVSMPWAARMVGDASRTGVHGSAIVALLDTCCGAAVVSHPAAGRVTATIDLRIDYLRPARSEQRLIARAELTHLTDKVAFLRAHVESEGAPGRPLATATGAFTVDGRRAASSNTGDFGALS